MKRGISDVGLRRISRKLTSGYTTLNDPEVWDKLQKIRGEISNDSIILEELLWAMSTETANKALDAILRNLGLSDKEEDYFEE